MIYTVTLNPALDKTVEIPDFSLDSVNRIVSVRSDPGGKGINVSKVIQKLGGKSVAMGILGGTAGRALQEALDMLELDSDDVHRLITELRLSGSYEYIILDCDFAMDAADRGLLRQTNAVVWIGDGSDISNAKIVRAYQALTILEQQEDLPLTSRISLIYNKFSNKTSSTIEGVELRNIGGAPRYEHATIQQVLGQLAGLLIFDKIA